MSLRKRKKRREESEELPGEVRKNGHPRQRRASMGEDRKGLMQREEDAALQAELLAEAKGSEGGEGQRMQGIT